VGAEQVLVVLSHDAAPCTAQLEADAARVGELRAKDFLGLSPRYYRILYMPDDIIRI
jgi:hypothetical protein